eukprot:GEMP01089500.1.p1 GENE.GEMP01089500.1~~GEMP01089500.1.p1  ORF type:complete len:236 (+),score=35.53 GEMP01089500.1:217-924(+)
MGRRGNGYPRQYIDVAMAVYGFSLVPSVDFPKVAERVSDLSAPWLRNFSGQDLSMILLALHDRDEASSLLVARLCEELLWKISDCSSAELSTLPRCAPKTMEGDAVMIHMMHHILERVMKGDVEPRHVAAILYGLAKRGFGASQLHRFTELVLGHAEEQGIMESMNPIDMAQVCFAIGRAGADGENMREALVSVASTLVESRPILQQRQAVVITEAFRRAKMQNAEFDRYLQEFL